MKPTSGDGDLTFTRSNDTATRVGPDGLIEKVRTNLVLQSNSFDTTWTNVSTTDTGGQAGYDGTNNAWLLAATADGGYINQTIAASVLHTESVYAKAGTLGWMLLLTSGGGNAYFNLTTGAVGINSGILSAKIESVGGGWYRCSISQTSTTTTFRIYPASGDGSLLSSGGNILIQAAQLEAGDIATEPILTTTAAVSVGPVANVPRLDYLGSSCPRLLLEPQRQNACLWSEQMDNADWIKTQASVTANNTTSPAGFVDADKLVGTALLNVHAATQGIGTPSAGVYSASAFFKKSEYNFGLIRLITDSAVNRFSALINLTTGAIENTYTVGSPTSTSVKVDDYGNGWYRLSVMSAHTSGDVTISVAMSNTASPSIAGGLPTFLADGTSGIFVWGCAVEAGSYSTSYIPTTAAAVTRLADACSKTGISSLIGQTQGTLFIEANLSNNTSDVFRGIAELNDGTTANRITLFRNLNGTLRLFVRQSSASQADISYATLVTGSVKIAVAYANNDISFYVNGVQVGTDTSATIPTCSDFDLGIQEKNTDRILGDSINQTLLFKTRLTNEQLQTLTSL